MAVNNRIIFRPQLICNQRTNAFQQPGIAVAALQWYRISELFLIQRSKGGREIFQATA